MSDICEGAIFEVVHPFIKDKWQAIDEDGPCYAESWRPGVKFEPISPEDSGAFADGVGKQILTVISIHKPGRFPERVFYTRQWEAPNGKRFGKRRLLVKTSQDFRRIIAGYRYPYDLNEEAA